MKERFNLGSELALAKGDFSNYLRANEDISRIQGQFLDKSEVTNKTPDKIIISYIDKSSSDAKRIDNIPAPTENEVSKLT